MCLSDSYRVQGENTKEKFSKKPFKPNGNKFKGKGKGKHTTTLNKEAKNPAGTHC